MILGGDAIRERLNDGEILRDGTWEDSSIKEASYALRIAPDGLLINGRFFEPGEIYEGSYLEIEPGSIAILSTIERMKMPADLVGRLGIRLNYALQGLTGLMGIQVDPLYGNGLESERLFIRVMNVGTQSIRLWPGEEVFTFELQQVTDTRRVGDKEPTWTRIKDGFRHQRDLSSSYSTQLQNELSQQSRNIRDYLQPLVMFGVFLLAVTMLGVSLSVVLSLRETPTAQVPSWFTDWAWIFLLLMLGAATLTTAAMGIVITWAGAPAIGRLWTKK